jgi:hypothetical protein
MRAEDLRLITLKNRMTDKEKEYAFSLLETLRHETEFSVVKLFAIPQPVINYLSELGYDVEVNKDIIIQQKYLGN